MDFESSLDLQSLIVTVVGVYTGMRVKDMHGILARNVTQVEHTPDAPRHFKILMTNTKNDMEGKSGDKGLAHYVPCWLFRFCSEVLDVDSSLSSCSSSSLAVCTPVSDVQRNIVVPDLAPVFLVVRLPRNRVMFIIFILTKYCISIYSGFFLLWRIHFFV